jgi:hypothetical protein
MIQNLTAKMVEDALGISGITLISNGLECPVMIGGSAEDVERLAFCWRAGTMKPRAHAYQVREWLIDNGIDPDTVPQILSASIADEVELKKALSRWEYVTDVPQDHPLVALVAAQIGKDVNGVWWDILKL